jgi:hypothetical protein
VIEHPVHLAVSKERSEVDGEVDSFWSLHALVRGGGLTAVFLIFSIK